MNCIMLISTYHVKGRSGARRTAGCAAVAPCIFAPRGTRKPSFRTPRPSASVHAIAGSTAKASAKGGDNEAIDFSSMARVELGDRNGLGATLRAQRHGRDHGPLASQLGRCGGLSAISAHWTERAD